MGPILASNAIFNTQGLNATVDLESSRWHSLQFDTIVVDIDLHIRSFSLEVLFPKLAAIDGGELRYIQARIMQRGGFGGRDPPALDHPIFVQQTCELIQ
jgi:hypothetical protein